MSTFVKKIDISFSIDFYRVNFRIICPIVQIRLNFFSTVYVLRIFINQKCHFSKTILTLIEVIHYILIILEHF